MKIRQHNLSGISIKTVMNSVFFAIQITLMIGLASHDNLSFIRGVAATTLLWMGYVWLEARYRLSMSHYIRSCVMLTIIADGFFGYYLGYYMTSTIFDKLLHIGGAYAFSLFACNLAIQRLVSPLPRLFSFVFVISLGISLGTLYEIAEFFMDTFGHPVLPGQPSLQDTNLDLIGDTVGALLAAIHSAVRPLFSNHN